MLCCVNLFQSCWTLCGPTDGGPPGSSVESPDLEYWRGLPCPPPGEMNEVNSVPNSLLDIADHRVQRAEQG